MVASLAAPLNTCDDTIYYLSVGATLNHGTLWRATTVGTQSIADTYYALGASNSSSVVNVDAYGDLTVPGVSTLTGAVTIGSGLPGSGMAVGVVAGSQLNVDSSGDLAVPGTSQLTGVVTTSNAANIGGSLTGASGGILNIGAGAAINGNVGIGTSTAPTYNLDSAGSTIRLYGSGSGSTNTNKPALIVEDSSASTLAISANNASNSSKLVFDASNNNVATLINGSEIARTITTGIGIGTTTPKSKLDIAGGLTVGAAYAGAYAASANGAVIQGPVGIGTTNPQSALDIAGGVAIGANYAGITAAPANGASVQGGFAVGTPVIGPYNPNLEVVGSGGLSVEPSDFSGASQYSYLKLTKAGGGWGNPATIQAGDAHTYDAILLNPLGGGVGIGTVSIGTSTLQVNGTVTATTFTGAVGVNDLNNGTNASATSYWRGDNTWATVTLGTGGDGSSSFTDVLPIPNGGTSASTASGALNNLFLGDGGALTSDGTTIALSTSRLPAIGSAVGSQYNNIFTDATGRVIASLSSYTPVACAPAIPSNFSFANQTGVMLNSTMTSNAVTLSGFAGCTATATCTGCTNILRNGISNGLWANFVNGDTITLQMTSATTAGTPAYASVTVGATSSTWTVTTGVNTPTLFSFSNQTGVNGGQTITSNTVTLAGTFSNVTATCGAGCTGISINGGAFTPGPVTGVSSGNTIAIQQLSAGPNNTTTSATVIVGLTPSIWQVTTGTDLCGVPGPAPGTTCADGSVYVGITPDGSVKMFTTPCDAGLTGTAHSCSGTPTYYVWSTLGTILTGVSSATTGRANTYMLHADDSNSNAPYAAADYCYNLNYLGHTDWYLPAENEMYMLYNNFSAVGGNGTTRYWTSTEYVLASEAYYISSGNKSVALKTNTLNATRCVRNANTVTAGAPNPFSFANLTNVAVGQTITSNKVVLSGPFSNATVTCGTGCTAISINGGGFTAGPITGVNSGANIAIQQTSSSSYNTMTSATVTVGSTTSSPWQITTATANGCSGSPPIGTVCSDGSVYAGVTPDGSVSMYATPCTYGQSGTAGNCTGSGTTLKWSTGTSVTTGVNSITTGRANTYLLHNDDGNADTPYSAADACYNLSALGHTDWYLPANSEMYALYNNAVAIGGFLAQSYWASTEASSSQATEYTFFGGSISSQNKNSSYYVRCVRNANTMSGGQPAAFNFSNQNGLALSVNTVSNTIVLAGPFTNATAICGTGCTGMSVNGGAFTAGPVSGINTGATLAIEQTSSASLNTMTSATVTVGGTTSSPWQVTTIAANGCTGSSPIGTVCSDGSVYAGLTPDGNVQMYVTPCDAGMSMVTGSCTGSRLSLPWSVGTSIATGVTNYNTGRANTYALHSDDGNADGPYSAADYCYNLNYLGHTDWYLPAPNEISPIYSNQAIIGGMGGVGSWYWTSTEVSSSQACMYNGGCNNWGKAGASVNIRCARNTAGAVNGSPNAFSFSNQTSSPINETITSNTITLSGPFVNATVTCGTGCTAMSINGAAFAAGPVSGVNSGATLAIQQTTSASFSTLTSATITVGSTTSSPWQVTTMVANACSGSPAIGTICQDGTVYAGLTPDGGSKMYVTPCDYPMTGYAGACLGTALGEPWSVGMSVTTGINNGNTGRANTYRLHNDDGNADTPYSAADACYNLNMYGHTDWYLPSYYELTTIMPNYVAITGFNSGWLYWTSTESASAGWSWANYVQPGNSSGSTDWKIHGHSVRCVRNDGPVTYGAPNAFSFTNQSGVPLGQTATSNSLTLGGPFSNATVTCGTGCTGISINGGSFVSGPLSGVNSGSTIAIHQTASASYSTMTSASVTVGSTTSGIWQVTTPTSDPCAVSSPPVGTYCADGTVYAGLTTDGNVKMFAAPCDAGMAYINGTCTGTRSALVWSSGTSVTTGATNPTTGRLNTLGLHLDDPDADGPYSAADYCYNLNYAGHTDWYLPSYNELNLLYANYSVIGGFGANYWTSNESGSSNAYYESISGGSQTTTGKNNTGLATRCIRNVNAAPTNVAGAFSFTNITGANTSTGYISNTVTIPGVFEGLTATCGSNCSAISVNGSAFVAGPVYALTTGSTIAIEQTTSSSFSTATTATVTVGSTTSTPWQVTTGTINNYGYFVLTTTSFTGNSSSTFAGWNAACLTELTTHTNWQGYATANSNGQLASGTVRIFGCIGNSSASNSTCQNPLANVPYYYAYEGSSAAGGASFIPTVNGTGPNDTTAWSSANRFGTSLTYWSFRGNATSGASVWNATDPTFFGVADCCNAEIGVTAATDYTRWQNGYVGNGASYPIICMVDP